MCAENQNELSKQHIPIVCATANDYEYTLVFLESMLKSADENTFYDIYILVDSEFTDTSNDFIANYFEEFKGQCEIIFLNVGTVFVNAYIGIKHIGTPTYFRLLIPDLLDLDKCIYLDTDIIVREDLGELYNTPLDDCYIAGVKAPSYYIRPNLENYCKQAHIPDISQYVNAGVLLMNLKKMRSDNIVKRFLELLPLNMESQDQDIINSACYGNIKFLPFKFNVMTKYASWYLSDYKGYFSVEELVYGWNNPVIIHYADKIKPWIQINSIMGEFWWEVCRNSKMKNYFFKIREEDFYRTALYYAGSFYRDSMTKKAVCRLFNVMKKGRLAIYGAGNKAFQLSTYMEEYGKRPECFIVSDKRGNPAFLRGIPVIEISDLGKENRDITLVIAIMEKYHFEILSNLSGYRFKEIVPLNDNWNY
ncbi:MAG: glycosyltransferase family 8 protein [Lachnospiraceae bacterium]|nr:glycosyltransferase family 8 protein [Lachnospiraceae bacterium]